MFTPQNRRLLKILRARAIRTRDDAAGRVFYTALGHNPDEFGDPWVLDLIGRAIEWAAHQR
jgi:type 1 glutamine amidotransferase